MENLVNLSAQIFNFLTYLAIGGFVLLALLAVLLSLPESKLRTFYLELFGRAVEVFGWGAAAVSTASVISPIDLIPDVIPILGWGDDVIAVIGGITAGSIAYFARQRRLKAGVPDTVKEKTLHGEVSTS